MRIVLAVLLVLLLVPGWSGAERLPLLGDHAEIHAEPVALVEGHSEVRRIGRLEWLGGVVLTSPDPAFGGFSSMTISGDRFTLLSDRGNIVRFRMGRDWRIRAPRFANLTEGPGTGWDKTDRDSESMAVDPATNDIWVGFENSNEIWRYDAGFDRPLGHAAPPAMRHWPPNGGAEAMLWLPPGRVVVIGEMAHRRGSRKRIGISFDGDPVVAPREGFRFSLLPPRHYAPSDATVLPDGRVLVLLRRFRLPYTFTAKLVIVDPTAIRPGATIRGRVIATFAEPFIHDNFEALAATREGDDTIVWIASDDNGSFLQRSLLLKFKLAAPAPASARANALRPKRRR
jgi:hypothetical protein